MLKQATLRPSRIGCPSIPATMKGVINSIKGVSDVIIHYDDRSVEVMFDDQLTSVEHIIREVGKEMGLALVAAPSGLSGSDSVSETCPM